MKNVDPIPGPSLLPYMSALADGIFIQFHHPDQQISASVDSQTVSSNPFTAVRRGCLSVGGDYSFFEMVFIGQSDHYSIAHSQPTTLNNNHIESHWQQTWSWIKLTEDQLTPMVLPCQIDDNGNLVPFRSLFYCTEKKCYCHPLCPSCGGALSLCIDDILLEESGLPQYSTSLERYLFCPECHQASKEAPFYTLTLNDGSSNRVKDASGLIEDFSRLLTKFDLSDQMPCIGCNEAVNCYGPDTRALIRMRPLHFYPFHMLMQQTPMFDAPEFIALLSGADAQQLLEGRVQSQKGHHQDRLKNIIVKLSQGTGFLFAREDRFFLELLYLKMTFLHELTGLIDFNGNEPHIPLSLNDVGVDLNIQGNRRPFFWNFAIKLMNPFLQSAVQAYGSQPSGALVNQDLANIWFCVLLANETQTASRINSVISEQLSSPQNPGDHESWFKTNQCFEPGNIFWYPHSIEIESQWQDLWLEALHTGLWLIQADCGEGSGFSKKAFDHRLEALKERIHHLLFKMDSLPVQTSQKETANETDLQIANILDKIIEHWPISHKEPEDSGVDPHQTIPNGHTSNGLINEDGDYVETVILSTENIPGHQPSKSEPDFEETLADRPFPDKGPEEEIADDLEKTVAISPPQSGDASHAIPDDDLEKTLVIGSPQTENTASPTPEDGLEKTVVIGPTQADDDLEKTVVIQPQQQVKTGGIADKSVVIESESRHTREDDLEKTVVIAPRHQAKTHSDADKTLTTLTEPRHSVEDDLEKTVVQSMPQTPANHDDLEKTVVISPSDGESRNSVLPSSMVAEKFGSEGLVEEELEETVVIQPKKDQHGKPKP